MYAIDYETGDESKEKKYYLLKLLGFLRTQDDCQVFDNLKL